MYSYNDLERLFFRYKAEAVPAGISIEKFCHSNKVPYNLFNRWYKDTLRKIVPVQVLDTPESKDQEQERAPDHLKCVSLASTDSLRILVDIRMCSGVHISQKNLSYCGLKELVEKLEVLC